jgi:D-alanyl-lipoteichoic acid acyltransferase DltB (MBOAT superfamily)
LAAFKYLGFFNEIFEHVASLFHGTWSALPTLILPVGISFYTFQSMGYVFDVYYKIRKPEQTVLEYALFVSFFPQILSGPIGRSKEMLPQFHHANAPGLKDLEWGIALFVWGLFKKLVIADRLGVLVDETYAEPTAFGMGVWWWSTVLYTFQLYTDFSSYSDMAMGTAKMLGIQIPENFKFPYKANSVTDFWRRWHLTLSFWLRDYIYTPVLFAKKKWKKNAVLFALGITFLLCGIWHGPKMTFVLFGVVQAAALIIEMLLKDHRENWSRTSWSLTYQWGSVVITFVFISFCFVLFRANSIQDAGLVYQKLMGLSGSGQGLKAYLVEKNWSRIGGIVGLLTLFVFLDEKTSNQLRKAEMKSKSRALAVAFLLSAIAIVGVLGKSDFIYFQF